MDCVLWLWNEETTDLPADVGPWSYDGRPRLFPDTDYFVTGC